MFSFINRIKLKMSLDQKYDMQNKYFFKPYFSFFFLPIKEDIEIVSVQYLIFDFWNSEDCCSVMLPFHLHYNFLFIMFTK